MKFVHAVNTIAKLKNIFNESSPFHNNEFVMIEFDLRSRVNTNGTLEVVIAHDICDVENAVTLEQWIAVVITLSGDKWADFHLYFGLKFDFKCIQIVELTLKSLFGLLPTQTFTSDKIWLNADILVGPGVVDATHSTPLPASAFIPLCLHYCPTCILSLGWTTGPLLHTSSSSTSHSLTQSPLHTYTLEMIDEMLDLCDTYNLIHVTFPVRYCHVPSSWEQLHRLLLKSGGYTLTIWANRSDAPAPFSDLTTQSIVHDSSNSTYIDPVLLEYKDRIHYDINDAIP